MQILKHDKNSENRNYEENLYDSTQEFNSLNI